ncbi:TPA: hypothetical protein ACVQMW_000007 [Yersinia enterocolitica]|nr:hypothetical protein [Yersinia enterocolitica]EKN4876847.1 hypothetical protein [Yersinia enterocolitica]ELW8170406.1 hypothetical protein [Yersinia enterocolitica]ELW8207347.1 hypothetical protein [Yersinia enterocolitica]EME3608778.1 hypothetical protein [Yersinia enterocolitica]
MTKTIRAGLHLAGMMLFSATTQAVLLDQQWGKWYGNISAMEFEINTPNAAGEVLTLLNRRFLVPQNINRCWKISLSMGC